MLVRAISIVLMLLAILGCMAKKQVSEGNLFHSPINPKLEIQIDPSWNYLGQVKYRGSGFGVDDSSFKAYLSDFGTYFFAETDGNDTVERFIILQFQCLEGGWHFLPNLLSNVKDKKDEGTEYLGEDQYQYCIIFKPVGGKYAEFFKSKSLSLRKRYALKYFARRYKSANCLQTILYGEKIKPRSSRSNKSGRARGRKFEAFNERCKESFTLRN